MEKWENKLDEVDHDMDMSHSEDEFENHEP
jgi:hypothetical protein